MLRCKNIIKEYKTDTSFFALTDVSLDINKGEFVSIVGKSGSGKSTLMNIIGLIDTPTSGFVVIDGVKTQNISSSEKAKLRNQKIGYVFQSFHLEPTYSVYKNIEIPLLVAGKSKSERRDRVFECLEKVDMLNKYKNLASNLSGGEKQRVSIARSLVNNPEIILADEPCGNLDSENSKNVMNILLKLKEENKTIVLITHSDDDAKIADRIIKMKDGKLIDYE